MTDIEAVLKVVEGQHRSILAKLDAIEDDIVKLKFKSSFWGAVGGSLTAIALSAVSCGCGSMPSQSYPEQTDLLGATVALVAEEDADTYCAGVHLGRGEILTAAHCVVDDLGQVPSPGLVFIQGVEEQGTLASHITVVVRVNVAQDLALLQIEDGYRPREEVDLAGSVPYIQEPVWACGHPWGLGWSITRGEVVSQRRLDGLDQAMIWIQVDIAVDPGNSGGPLVDSDGALVGITSFKMGRQSGFAHLDSIRSLLDE